MENISKPVKSNLWVIGNIYFYVFGFNLVAFFAIVIIAKILPHYELWSPILLSIISLISAPAYFFVAKMAVESVLEKTSIDPRNFFEISSRIVLLSVFLFMLFGGGIATLLTPTNLFGSDWYISVSMLSKFGTSFLSSIFFGIATYFWLKKLSKSQDNLKFPRFLIGVFLVLITVFTIISIGIHAWSIQEQKLVSKNEIKNETTLTKQQTQTQFTSYEPGYPVPYGHYFEPHGADHYLEICPDKTFIHNRIFLDKNHNYLKIERVSGSYTLSGENLVLVYNDKSIPSLALRIFQDKPPLDYNWYITGIVDNPNYYSTYYYFVRDDSGEYVNPCKF